jgi:short-subunit dehydrogenase
MARNQTRHVVITGASAGVGRVTAHEFAREGARLTLLARSAHGLAEAAAECRALGATVSFRAVDVSDDQQVVAVAAAAEQEFGPIDVWVNNAMVSVVSLASQITPAEYRRVTEVTYLGAVYGTLAAVESMRARNRGVVIQVGSALAYRSIPLQSAYCAAKHALLGFTEALRTELMHQGSQIQVTLVHMPALNTPQFDWVRTRMPRRAQPVPPVFQPEVAARAIVRASHERRREWLVGFPTVMAVWADKLFPAAADWYLARNGFDSQQTSEAEDPGRPDNLFEPMPPEYYRPHGRFDGIAKPRSVWQMVTRHRWVLVVGGFVVALALLFAVFAD